MSPTTKPTKRFKIPAKVGRVGRKTLLLMGGGLAVILLLTYVFMLFFTQHEVYEAPVGTGVSNADGPMVETTEEEQSAASQNVAVGEPNTQKPKSADVVNTQPPLVIGLEAPFRMRPNDDAFLICPDREPFVLINGAWTIGSSQPVTVRYHWEATISYDTGAQKTVKLPGVFDITTSRNEANFVPDGWSGTDYFSASFAAGQASVSVGVFGAEDSPKPVSPDATINIHPVAETYAEIVKPAENRTIAGVCYTEQRDSYFLDISAR